jgi:DMSO/TMAO reductase YedYZ molybdopterin-dependent catalytic subunit
MTTLMLLVATCLGQGQAPAGGLAVEPLAFDPAAWKALPRVEAKVTERGRAVTYSGIPLATVLTDKLKGDTPMAGLRSLADAVVLVRAEDGYQAAVSAAAVAMDKKGERFLLALERDGQPLDKAQGPVRLIVPGDPERVRWVRQVSGIDLVRLPKPKPKK